MSCGALLSLILAACTASRNPVDIPPPPPAPTTTRPDAPGPVKAAPRWVRVAELSGAGEQRTAGFDIAADVIQWRATVTCSSGRVEVAVVGKPKPIINEECPGRFFGFAVGSGGQALDIRTGGQWEAVIDQQVDHPLDEPPLAGMTDQSRLASGAFSGIEMEGRGTATLFELPGGGRALRLDPFFVTPNTDLFVWASEAESPRTSADALFTPHVQLEELKASAGPQNYLLPPTLPFDRVRSIVIWCEPVRIAYAAAPLTRT